MLSARQRLIPFHLTDSFSDYLITFIQNKCRHAWSEGLWDISEPDVKHVYINCFSIPHSALPLHNKRLLSIFLYHFRTNWWSERLRTLLKVSKWPVQDSYPGLSSKPMLSSTKLCPVQWEHFYPVTPLPISLSYFPLTWKTRDLDSRSDSASNLLCDFGLCFYPSLAFSFFICKMRWKRALFIFFFQWNHM